MKSQLAVEQGVQFYRIMSPRRREKWLEHFEAEVRRKAILETLQWVLDPEIGEFSPWPTTTVIEEGVDHFGRPYCHKTTNVPAQLANR